MTQAGLVFNIQRYSIHDGPGIRTCIFLKGCPLKCLWCSNPESQAAMPELAFFEFRCQGCGRCLQLCPRKAIKQIKFGSKKVNLTKCDLCGQCVKDCPSGAWKLYGKVMTVAEVMEEVIRDIPFYRKSGGGITITGGEPLSSSSFTKELLMAARDEGIHTAMETTGYGNSDYLKGLIPYLDLVLFDLKHMDSGRHRSLTGKSNSSIHNNARLLADSGVQINFRIPLIPGLNDSEENLRATGKYAKSLGVERIDILPFHQFGESKYSYLAKSYKLRGIRSLDQADVIVSQTILEEFVPIVTIGGA